MIDAGGCYVMPGGIDPHTHLEFAFMGGVYRRRFRMGHQGRAVRRHHHVVDLCIPDPGQSMLAAYQDWRRKSEKAASDYGFHMAVTSWSKQVFDEMETVVKTYGINSFKHFLAYKGALMVNDDELYNSFARCAHLGALPLVHAENGDVVARMQEALLERGITGPEGHAFSRPPEVEGEATNRAIMIADMTGAPLYVVHTSCREAHEAIARARAAGKRVYGEPLIQHLTLDAGEYANNDWDHAAQRVMSPPFRDKVHQDSLWAGLQSGSLQVVATDHCAFTTEQKRIGFGDFRKIPNGTGGLEDRLPVLWTAGVNTGRLTKEEFVAVTSANIARILNVYPRKGAVAVGSDADLVVWDPSATKTITRETTTQPHRLQRVRGLSPAPALPRRDAVAAAGSRGWTATCARRAAMGTMSSGRRSRRSMSPTRPGRRRPRRKAVPRDGDHAMSIGAPQRLAGIADRGVA